MHYRANRIDNIVQNVNFCPGGAREVENSSAESRKDGEYNGFVWRRYLLCL